MEGLCDAKSPILRSVTSTREVACWLYHDEDGNVNREKLSEMGVKV